MGDKRKLDAKVVPESFSQEVEFTSSDPTKVKIDKVTGEWEALVAGNPAITVQWKEDTSVQASVKFTIKEADLEQPPADTKTTK